MPDISTLQSYLKRFTGQVFETDEAQTWLQHRRDCEDVTFLEDASVRIPSLGDIDSAPQFLFAKGRLDVLDRRLVAMVGSREIDSEGVHLTRNLASELVEAGVVLVSGGARGVDTLVHSEAVERGAPTVVVLPGGIDKPTPAANRRLFERVVDTGGLLLSEYPPGISARKHHFHRRNHLIAALGESVVIARAKSKGGTHITAQAADGMGRPLFCVPGSPMDGFSTGCLDWIRRGATCAWKAEHILQSGASGTLPNDRREPEFSDDEEILVTCIRSGRRSIDDLMNGALAPSRVHVVLLGLQIRGIVERDASSGLYRVSRASD